MKNQLPIELQPLFWSYDFQALDLKRDHRLVMLQVINYGRWHAWQWLVHTYGRDAVKAFIQTTSVSEFRPGALKLITLLLGLKNLSYAPRGAH